MTTLFIQSPGLVGVTPLGIITPPTAAELAVFAIGGLVGWWRADIAFTSSWLDRKNTRRLTNLLGSSPTVNLTGIGGKPALVTSSTAAFTDPDGLAMIPLTGDFTVVQVFKPIAATIWGTWGVNQALATSTYAMMRTDEKIQFFQNGVSMFIAPSAFTAAAPKYLVDSWEQAVTTRAARVNGASVGSAVTAQVNPNSQLVVGSGWAAASGGSGAAGQMLAETLVFSKPLAKASNATDLASVESYITGRYGAVFA